MSKKKIGILTFHRAINYGAVLQAYATQTVLNDNGFQAEIIDYKNQYVKEYYETPFGAAKTLKGKIASCIRYRVQKKRNNEFKGFVKNRLKLSCSYTRKNIVETGEKYDSFMVGSDQVWNLICTDYDATYFLDFVNNDEKKQSFAISLGKFETDETAYKNYLPLIEKFANISLREVAGKQFIDKHIGERATLESDPVFLLKKKEWVQIAEVPEMSNYVLIYSVDLPNRVLEHGRKMSKLLGKKLVIITLKNKKIALNENEYLKIPSPEEFIGWICCADFVVSNSFHGTAFSILLNKQFHVVKNDEKKGLDNSRLRTLLSNFGLENRLIDADAITDTDEIDYNSVGKIIENTRVINTNRLLEIAGE